MGDTATTLLLAAIIVSAITTGIAVAVSLYLYRWRRILMRDQRVTVPEELVKWLSLLHSDVQQFHKSLVAASQNEERRSRTISKQLDGVTDNVGHISNTTLTLQRALDERDSEIRRLRQGYDNELLRRFVTRFLRVKQAVEDAEISNPSDQTAIDQISRLLDDALDECGVEKFAPEIGTDYRTAPGVADSPRIVESADPATAFRINEIIEPGYRFRNSAGAVLVAARVSIFMPQKHGA